MTFGGWAFVAFVGVGVASCSTVPNFDLPNGPRGITVAQIVDKVNCELAAARDESKKFTDDKGRPDKTRDLDNWIANVILTLQVDDGAGLSPSLAYLHPAGGVSVFGGQFFGMNVGGQLSESRQRVYSQTYTVTIAKVKSEVCASKKWERFNLQGDLGIKDIVYMGLNAFDKDSEDAVGYTPTIKGQKVTDSISQTAQFVVVRNVNGTGPTWTLNHYKGPGGLFGISRTDTHRVVVTLAPITNEAGQTLSGKTASQTTIAHAQSVAAAKSEAVELGAAISNNLKVAP